MVQALTMAVSIHQVRLGRHCVIPEVGLGGFLAFDHSQPTGFFGDTKSGRISSKIEKYKDWLLLLCVDTTDTTL